MPVSVEQWRIAVGSFTSVRLVNYVSYTRHGIHSQYLLKYLILCVFYAYTRVYMYMFVQYMMFSCMVKLVFFSVSVNNLVFSNVDYMPIHYIVKCSQYIGMSIFFMCSLHLLYILYSTLFKSLCVVLSGRICCGYKHNVHVKKVLINVYCQRMMMLCCLFHSCLSLQLLLLSQEKIGQNTHLVNGFFRIPW